MNQIYWDQFYQHVEPMHESPFGTWVLPKLPDTGMLLDVGCGNGRDTTFFGTHKPRMSVVGIDSSKTGIQSLASHPNVKGWHSHINYVNIAANSVDIIYNRFFLHAIGPNTQFLFLRNSFEWLKKDGIIFIECRSIGDQPDYYYTDKHFRRPINIDELVDEMQTIGYIITYQLLYYDLATYKHENPLILRIRGKK